MGETLDFLALTSGESPSGEVLDTWGKAFALLGLIPVAGDLIQVVRRSPAPGSDGQARYGIDLPPPRTSRY